MFPSSCCTERELQYLYDIGVSFIDSGSIVDLGCGNGGSTATIAMGLVEQRAEPAGQIHAFDLFDMGGYATLDKFKSSTQDYAGYICVHPGNIVDIDVPNIDISTLFIDSSKNLDAHKAAIGKFASRLKTKWMMLNQDFGRPHLVWIHYSTALLVKYCDDWNLIDDMVVLSGSKKIPRHVLKTISQDDFSLNEKVDLISSLFSLLNGILARGGVPYNAILELSLSHIFANAGNLALANDHLNKFNEIIPNPPRNLTIPIKKLRQLL